MDIKGANYLVNIIEKINSTLYIASDAKKNKNWIRNIVDRDKGKGMIS
jgi:hypothetical protein